MVIHVVPRWYYCPTEIRSPDPFPIPSAESTYKDWRGTSCAENSLVNTSSDLYELAGLDHERWTILAIDIDAHSHGAPPDWNIRVYAADRDILAVQRLLGHTSVTTTQRYTNPPDNAKQPTQPTPSTSFYDQRKTPHLQDPARGSQQSRRRAHSLCAPPSPPCGGLRARGCGVVGPDGARLETPSMAEKAPRLTPHRKIPVTPLAPWGSGNTAPQFFLLTQAAGKRT